MYLFSHSNDWANFSKIRFVNTLTNTLEGHFSDVEQRLFNAGN